jgi:hypothetical protein
MITFLVVGRNDGYGVNLHKRTAISLNYMAGLCAETDDEIIYVDCNTPAHELTLTESIADTLTPEARARLKTYRITGEQMEGAIGKTPLVFSDELSRNVGIRRSNPRNPWLLSTNCDILIHPLGGKSIQEILSGLKPRFYLCARVGIPIAQWQSLDRANLIQISEFCDGVIHQGFRLAPEKEQPWLRFASVGDFQLAPRGQWFEIRGCEEGMKLWGHSDANNAKRLSLLNGGGRTPDLTHEFAVMHLDHNPAISVSHEKILVHNDWQKWIEEVREPSSQNSDAWGLPDLELPAIQLQQNCGLNAQAILRSHRRRRSALAGLRLKAKMKLWKTASAAANWLEKKSHQS